MSSTRPLSSSPFSLVALDTPIGHFDQQDGGVQGMRRTVTPTDGIEHPTSLAFYKSAGDGVDGGPDGGPDAPAPDPNPPPPPPPAPPYVPQQIGMSFGIELNATLIAPFLSNGGGTIGVVAGVDSTNGAAITGYSSTPGGTSNGFSVGVSIGVTGSVGWPTSAPTTVVGGNAGPYGASVSYTPSQGGSPAGTVGGGASIGVGAPAGLYSTQTTSTVLAGANDPAGGTQGPLNGQQCIEGDLNGDGHLSDDEMEALEKKRREEAEKQSIDEC
jgi:hypothetical protein